MPTDRILLTAPDRNACWRLHPVEVAGRQAVPLPDEGQRRGALHVLRAGREVGARPWVVDGCVQAHRHAADGVGQQVEAEQVHLGVVVDLAVPVNAWITRMSIVRPASFDSRSICAGSVTPCLTRCSSV